MQKTTKGVVLKPLLIHLIKQLFYLNDVLNT